MTDVKTVTDPNTKSPKSRRDPAERKGLTSVAADMSQSRDLPVPVGNVVHVSTSTRGLRGIYLGSRGDYMILWKPVIVADIGNPSNYFKGERARAEEESGARLGIVNLACNFAGDLGKWSKKSFCEDVQEKDDVQGIVAAALDPEGTLLPGVTAYLSTPTFEYYGQVEAASWEWIRLADARWVNDPGEARDLTNRENGRIKQAFKSGTALPEEFSITGCAVSVAAVVCGFIK